MADDDDFMFLSAAAAAVIIIRRRRNRRLQHQRTLWSRQWLLDRTTDRGILNFVDYELHDDMCGFQGFLRMSSNEFGEILEIITPEIQRMDTVMRDSITPKEMLVVTLRYLASGE